ncbi:unnamed protein product [Aphanomyces euteiches]
MRWRCPRCATFDQPPQAVPVPKDKIDSRCTSFAVQCLACNQLSYPCEGCKALVPLDTLQNGRLLCRMCGLFSTLDKELRDFLLFPPHPYEEAIRKEAILVQDVQRRLQAPPPISQRSTNDSFAADSPSQPSTASEEQAKLDELRGSWTTYINASEDKSLQSLSVANLGMLKLLQSPTLSEDELNGISDLLQELLVHRRTSIVAVRGEVQELDELHSQMIGLLHEKRCSAVAVAYTNLQLCHLQRQFRRLTTPYMRIIGIANVELPLLFEQARGFMDKVKSLTPSDTSMRSRRRKKLKLPDPPMDESHLVREKIHLWRKICLVVGAICIPSGA